MDTRQWAFVVRLTYRRTLPFYGPRLFFLYEARPLRLFFYQQQLLIGRLLRSASALARAVVGPGGKPFLVETPNQALARARALQSGYELGDAILPGQISRRFSIALLLWNLATWLVHPVMFLSEFRSPRVRHVHERLFFGPRTRAMVAAIRATRLQGLTVSNDHMGQSFQLATVAAALGLPVTYLQHGAITPHFPRNDFALLLVWDRESAEIYKAKTRGEIVIDPRLKSASSATRPLPDNFLLCALSTDYPLWPTVLALRRIVKICRPRTLLVRFHPSDKRAGLVSGLVGAFSRPLERDVASRPFMQSFAACELAFISTSSVLRDAVEIQAEKVIWLRHLGSSKDVYGISSLPKMTVSSLTELENILPSSMASLQPIDNDRTGIFQ